MAKRTQKPREKRPENPIDLETIAFQIRESYKTARANIVYSIIKKGCKKIVFTSSSKGEGKTVTSVNVAIALAQQVNTRVLIIDCDLRRPQLHNALNIDAAPGLTNFLNGEVTQEEIIRSTKVDNLKAVTYGAVPPNPSELMASGSMKDFIKSVENDFDFIIFDTPPIGVVIDSIPIIKSADGVVIVIKNDATTYPDLKKIIGIINRNGGKILGTIINSIDTTHTRKFGRKYYYKYDYKYGYGYGYY